MEKEKLCLRCMRKIGNNTSCPYCQGDNSPQEAPCLPLKTVVGGRYLIGKAVQMNDEGITYNAFDLQLKKPISLRELFPKDMLSRGEDNYCLVNIGKAAEFIDIKDEFLQLWKKLLNISGFTALPGVFDVFEDLGTVYTVSEFLGEGQSLREFLLAKEQGYISWDEARVLFMPLVSAMGELHSRGIVHGGISPVNLVIDAKGKLKFTGFCVPQLRNEKGVLAAELFDGYAAVEQYGVSSSIAPATDIYAFAAVLYRALIGSTPMSAASRLTNDKLMIPGKFAEQLPAYVINALVNALQILPEERTPSVELLRNELSASPAAAGTAAEAYASMYEEEAAQEEYFDSDIGEFDEDEDVEAPVSESQGIKKSTIAAFVISVVICLAILIVAVVAIKGISGNSDKPEITETNAPEITDTVDDERVTNPGDVTSVILPDFRGKVYDDIKNDEKYKSVLIFKTEYIDSDQERGTVVSQSRNAGTEVTSINPLTITLKISNGLEVPDVAEKNLDDAVEALKNAGFKNIKSDSAKVASNEKESKTVYMLAYEDTKTGDWAEIPSDKRLSSGDVIILYYYGEYVEPTEEPVVSQESTTQANTEVQNQEPVQPSENTTEQTGVVLATDDINNSGWNQ